MRKSPPVRRPEPFPTRPLRDGEPCSPTCGHHVSHPCDRCGRTQARGAYTPPPARPDAEVKAGPRWGALRRRDTFEGEHQRPSRDGLPYDFGNGRRTP